MRARAYRGRDSVESKAAIKVPNNKTRDICLCWLVPVVTGVGVVIIIIIIIASIRAPFVENFLVLLSFRLFGGSQHTYFQSAVLLNSVCS